MKTESELFPPAIKIAKSVKKIMSNKKLKPIPKFLSEDEEAKFWNTHDSTEYVDWSQAVHLEFPNLRSSSKTITLRLPQSLLDSIKKIANRRDVPYQSLMKIFLAEKVSDAQKSAF